MSSATSTPTKRSELIRAMDAGLAPSFTFFWKPTAPKGQDNEALGPWVYSQWYPSAFRVDGVHYATAEHFMMAAKARLFGDDETLAQILAAEHPAQVQRLGRRVRGFREPAWESERFAIVVAGSLAKFSQDPALARCLLDSGEQTLVEASPQDRIWGIGRRAEDPAALDPRQWRGENLLGFALMVARERLATRPDS